MHLSNTWPSLSSLSHNLPHLCLVPNLNVASCLSSSFAHLIIHTCLLRRFQVTLEDSGSISHMIFPHCESLRRAQPLIFCQPNKQPVNPLLWGGWKNLRIFFNSQIHFTPSGACDKILMRSRFLFFCFDFSLSPQLLK